MKKIGDVTSTATQAGEFTNGNVAAGIAPTILEGEWFNSLQREVLNVLLKANIKQDPEIDDQLTQAIIKLAGTAFGGKIKQTLGDSTTDVVSQKTVTDELRKTSTVDGIYPVGIVVWFAQNKNPNTLFPNTKWQYIGENKTIRLAKADGSNVFTTGGADAIKLTEAQLPAHGHTFSGTTSSYDYGTKKTNTTGAHVHSFQGMVRDNWKAAGQDDPGQNQWQYGDKNTTQSGDHSHTVAIGAHTHTISGTTGKTGSGSEINITNSFITLMGWLMRRAIFEAKTCDKW